MDRFIYLIRHEIKLFFTIKTSDRTWELPFGAALSCGIPLFIGIYFNHIEYGLMSSLGAMVFLYTPNTPLYHRMIVLMCATTGISACFLLGLVSSFYPPTIFIMITIVTILITSICRYFRVSPPASLFFIMALSVASNMHADVLQIPFRTGLVFLGALLASCIAFIYSLYMLHKNKRQLAMPKFDTNFEYVIVDSILIGLFVGASVVIAQSLGVDQFYWVPISCLVVIQGRGFREILDKNIQRVIGTTLGMMIAWILLSISTDDIFIASMVMLLTFIIEYFVVRHYAFSVIFITPLTLFLAEAGSAVSMSFVNPTALISARLLDIFLGCFIGLVGGYIIYKTKLKKILLKNF